MQTYVFFARSPTLVRLHLELLVLARREFIAIRRMGVYYAMAEGRNRKT